MVAEVRVGLIGCGYQGRVLSKALTQVEKTKLVAVADKNEAAAKHLAEMFKVERSFTDYNDLLSMRDIDGVMISVPHSLLAGMAMDSANADKHIFIEKPMAVNHLEAKQVIETAERRKVKLMVGYCLRYIPVRMAMKELLAKGAIGEIDLVLGGKGGGQLTGWLADASIGGGILLFLGVHLIDQVLWMVDSEVERVFGEVNMSPTLGVDETDVFTMRFKNGVLANLSCSMCLGGAIEGGFDFVEVGGSEGSVRSDWIWCGDGILKLQSKLLRHYSSPTTIRFQGDPLTPMYVGELNEFVDAIIKDREPAVRGEDGLRVLEIVDAVFRSGRTGQPLDFPMGG